ncbi:molybdate ABC transporter substrate-binding protein [Hoyosella rhizosphaerae]|uniref:Molybdate ABC transporter substrate-binding protein n=1 Tax=Hoyosella rhizosphaerae TaxID=1755582 RepID=A0A916U2H7_9ACTN|nr:molybdate ABC transporter substrate-binding protein [Hoyosella rhizosphaerae]MBN4926743.1 molybdate ABC transporter substrate-binding protein [Hoyosella rhizosphaerae]GGC56832.1 molybdate ABC transporter substrate-binding protein [Hoyosella rhizosphaerae]
MTRVATRLAVLLTIFAIIGTACGTSPGTETIRIAAASDLRFALDNIIDEYTNDNPDVDITVSYGSSGMFVQQLLNGAPFDIYLSADRTYVDDVVDGGLASASDTFAYAGGRLAVWTRNDSGIDVSDGLTMLLNENVRRIAIANPAHAPYGRAAQEALDAAGVADAVRSKIVTGENIGQAAEFVASGNADVGIIALSLAVSPQLSEVGVYVEIDAGLFSPLHQAGVVLSSAGRI